MPTPRTLRQVLWLLAGLVAFVAGAIALVPHGHTSPSAAGTTQPLVDSTTTATVPQTATLPTSSHVEGSSQSSLITSSQPAPTAPIAAAASSTTNAVGSEPPSAASSRPGEGRWHPFASTRSGPVLWATTVHPLAKQPDVIATYALFNPARVHAALFNGTVLPGGGPWNNGARVMPAAQPALLGAFNGGFLFKHIKGGYFTESRVVKPLIDGDATLAIGVDGRIVLGKYGRDLTNDGSWVSMRQNLPPVIDGGRQAVTTATEQGSPFIYWGDDYGHVTLDRRSAICRRADGLLTYIVTERVDITGLANVLLAAQCDFAMELDINGSWPQFVSFTPSASGPPTAIGLTPTMTHLNRVITGSTKDFIALFDPTLLAPHVTR